MNVDERCRSVNCPQQSSTLDASSRDLHQTQNTVENEGFFKPSATHTMLRLTEIVVLHAIGFYLLFNGRVGAGLGNNIATELSAIRPVKTCLLYHAVIKPSHFISKPITKTHIFLTIKAS